MATASYPSGLPLVPYCLGSRFDGRTLFNSIVLLESIATRVDRAGEHTPQKHYFNSKANLLYEYGWSSTQHRF